jgi:hypothetical protein
VSNTTPPARDAIQLTFTVRNEVRAHERDDAWREILIGNFKVEYPK